MIEGGSTMKMAPWTDLECVTINLRQIFDDVVHCPNDGRLLIANNNGFHCPICVYTQTHAPDFMLVVTKQ
jgi:hypothetical protein